MDNPDTKSTQQRRLHPLVATAAGAVIIASLAATAAVTGLFPKASSTSAQTDQTQAAQVATQPGVVDSAAPANTAAQQQAAAQAAAQQAAQQAPQRAPAPTQQQYAQQQQAQPAPQYAQQQPSQPAYCSTCGTVEGISAVRQEGHGTGIGAVGGAVAGGVVGNQFGSGNGRTAMTVLGASAVAWPVTRLKNTSAARRPIQCECGWKTARRATSRITKRRRSSKASACGSKTARS